MPLHLHDRTQILGPVQYEMEALLERSYSGEDLSERETRRVQSYLNDLRDREMWLACGCRAGVDPPPLLSIRRREGTISLVRHGETLHNPDCPYYRDPTDRTEQGNKAPAESPILPFSGSLATLHEVSPVENKETGEKQAKPRSQPARPTTPRLGRILLTLMHEAGLDYLNPDEIRDVPERGPMAVSPQAQYEKLDPLMEKPFAGELSLGDVTCRFLSYLPAFLARFRTLEPKFPPNTRPQGFVICPVDDWEGDRKKTTLHLHAKGGERECEVYGRVRQYGKTTTSGPFMFLGQIGKVAATGRYEVISGYLHPIFNKTLLVPVDSGFEREVGAVLMQQMLYWKRKHDWPVVFHKPLFDQRGPDSTWLRPDFELIDRNNKRLVVEALGYTEDSAYMARKALMREVLEAQDDVTAVLDWDMESDVDFMRRVTTGVILRARDELELVE